MKNKIFFAIFMFLWIVLIALNFLIKTPEFSEAENRYMARFPKFNLEDFFTGKFSKDMDKYINDHFVFRDKWLNIRASYERALNKDEISNVYIGKDGYLFDKFDKNNIKQDEIDLKIEKINKFANDLNIDTHVALIPNSIYINRDKLPNNAVTYDQRKLISDIYVKLNNTININVLDSMEKNKSEELYFKLDHHMNSKGAFLAYEQITKEMLKKETTIRDYEIKRVSDSFYGTTYSKVNLKTLKPDILEIYRNKKVKIESAMYDLVEKNSIYNFDYLKKKDKYSIFLDGNHSLSVIKTDNKNGKKLLIIKDSYAHIMSQFFINDYEEVHFIDLRYYNKKVSDYIKENNITNVIFIYNLTNFLSDIAINNIR